MIKLLTQNSKIKLSKVKTFNFGIPAFKSSTGLKTCPNAGACANGCYALAGAYKFSQVARAFEERLRITQLDAFINIMRIQILKSKARRIRIHDSGDFYSKEYLEKWILIMRTLPNVQFYAYTKMVSMLNNYKPALPDNFTIVYSFGGIEDRLINTKKDRHSIVFETHKQMQDCGYTDTSETDDAAADKSILKIGLVYHGNKKLINTNWSKVSVLKGITNDSKILK